MVFGHITECGGLRRAAHHTCRVIALRASRLVA
jgi:hypothetical protein